MDNCAGSRICDSLRRPGMLQAAEIFRQEYDDIHEPVGIPKPAGNACGYFYYAKAGLVINADIPGTLAGASQPAFMGVCCPFRELPCAGDFLVISQRSYRIKEIRNNAGITYTCLLQEEAPNGIQN